MSALFRRRPSSDGGDTSSKDKFSPYRPPVDKPSPRDFSWRLVTQRTEAWDGSDGVFVSKDPMARYADYPHDKVTDPRGTGIWMTPALDHDYLCDSGVYEVMFVVDRTAWLSENPGRNLQSVEYFSVISSRRSMFAVSWGEDGLFPVDAEDPLDNSTV